MEATADMIQSRFLSDDRWADMVARTEIRRASTDAALDYYRESDIEMKEWLVAWDEACEICAEAQAMGPVPLGDDFGEAGEGPPGHPNCLCVILPVVPEGEPAPVVEDLGEGDVEVADEPVIEPEQVAVPSTSTMPYELSPTKLQPGWSDAISTHNIDAARGEQNIRGAFDQVIEQPVRVAMRENSLIAVLDEGRMKSVYELPVNAKGQAYLDYRTEVETDSIGVPSNVDPGERPIYGSIHMSNYTSAYGDHTVILKDEIKGRTSVCVGDSFMEQNPVLISDIRDGNASIDDLTRAMNSGALSDVGIGRDLFNNDQVGYWEVQVHGGVSTADIAEIVLPKRSKSYFDALDTPHEIMSTRRLYEALERSGIPYRFADK
jgi:hypothetical protein